MSSLIGRKLGQYEVIELLGSGGMATVYLGRQASIDRNVAIKVLPPHPGLDDSFKERFQLEAKTIGGLQHPNILPLHDYGTQDDVLYLVMAYIETGSLEDRLDSGALDIAATEKYLRSIASGLDYAHSRGVIHRDIKPGNILMNGEHALLADFGMVKMTAGESNLTGTAIVGTPAYMAPEQAQGVDVDHRIDIYALGVMLYEMLTGQQPYTGGTPMQVIVQHLNEPIPDVRHLNPNVPPPVSAVVQRAMAKDPDDRYQSASELADAFSKALHPNDDTYADIQAKYPINPQQTTPAATVNMSSSQVGKVVDATMAQGTNQTIVVRESTNPLVLLGGFALIALIVVVVAVFLINSQNPADEEDTSIVSATLTPTTATAPAVASFGSVQFSMDASMGDTATVRLEGVRPLSDDLVYAAWLINTETDDVLPMGRIIVNSFGEGNTAPYTDAESRMLPAYYNGVLITAEESIGDEPSGEVMYSALLPIELSTALVEIFVTSPNSFESDGVLLSLLDGAINEATVAVQHAGYAVEADFISGVRTHAEHTINVLRGGEAEDFNGNDRAENPGRGYGVFYFIDAIETLLDDVRNQPTATESVRSNAEFINTCLTNVSQWTSEVVGLELAAIAGEARDAVQDDAVRSRILAEQILTGFDLNGNGFVEPYEGECGLNQIPEYGLQFAQMQLIEGDARTASEE